MLHKPCERCGQQEWSIETRDGELVCVECYQIEEDEWQPVVFHDEDDSWELFENESNWRDDE